MNLRPDQLASLIQQQKPTASIVALDDSQLLALVLGTLVAGSGLSPHEELGNALEVIAQSIQAVRSGHLARTIQNRLRMLELTPPKEG